MAMEDIPALSVDALTRSGWRAIALGADSTGFVDMWAGFSSAAKDISAEDPEAAAVLDFLARLSSLYLTTDGGTDPYQPMMSLGDRRSMVPADLTAAEVAFMVESFSSIDESRLRARFAYLLWLRGPRAERHTLAIAAIDNYTATDPTDERWAFDEEANWNRAIDLALRLGSATAAQLAAIEKRLLDQLLGSGESYTAIRIAEILYNHRLATASAEEIAEHLLVLAQHAASPLVARRYLDVAANWFARADLESKVADVRFQVVESWIYEADVLATGAAPSHLSAAAGYESALQALRRIPKDERVRLGAASLGETLQMKIRDEGREGLSEMKLISSSPFDMSKFTADAMLAVSDKPPLEAVLAYVTLGTFANPADDRRLAEELLSGSIMGLIGNVTFTRDGRVSRRSRQDGDMDHGIPWRTWDQMVKLHAQRASLMVQGVFWPALTRLSSEHHLTIDDFAAIVRESAVVPADRTRLFAVGLHFGFQGNFQSALHLLTPQIENLVRVHLQSAGVTTSTISADGIETENGLSALMESDAADRVFGDEVAYEIRAVFCDPDGPNLRNQVAHGLLTWEAAGSVESAYAWWFALKLVYLQFWNRTRTDQADA